MSCGKIPYQSKGEAKFALTGLKKAGKHGNGGEVYFCDECQVWHTTSSSAMKRGKKRIKRQRFIDSPEVNFKAKDLRKDISRNKPIRFKKQ